MLRFRLTLAGILALLIASSAVADDPTEALYGAIGERLSLMRDVAAWKWLHDRPIEDLEREVVVIEAAAAGALAWQIRPESAERFFQIQIEAAKDIQRYWFDHWRVGAEPRSAPDLADELRPQLLLLGDEITRLMGRPVAHDPASFTASLQVEGLGPERIDLLYDSLRQVQRFDSRLQQILQTGVLRVGTTGDYAPFSHTHSDEDVFDLEIKGIDIELAADLAQALEVELALVRTSWPTLTEDMLAGRYDVAMSGVSRTLARARVGQMSVPYYVGGKMPIARCEDRKQFGSLAGIDQPGVRVIVNPGGTNERFLDTHLEEAQKVLHPDNRTIFTALLAGEADVMITDSIEVALQARKTPGLCGTMGRTLTYQEKAYFMPADAELKAFVDTWLSLRLGDGTVGRLLEKHLSVP